MRCTKFQVPLLLGVGIFLAGSVCFVAVAFHRVFPALEEQSLKEINCTIASSDVDMKTKCSQNKGDDSSFPCLRIYVLCGKEAQRNGTLEGAQPRLLLKDFHSLDKQCTFEPDDCVDKTGHGVKPRLSHGSALKCYYNPKNPDQVVRQKASKESYNKLVLHSVVWPLAIVLLGVAVIATTTCYYSSPSRYGYDKLPGVSITSLQQDL